MQGMHEQSQDPTVTQLRLGTWKFKEFAWIKDSFTLFGLQAETSERLCSQTLASAVIMSMTGDASNNVSSVISKEFRGTVFWSWYREKTRDDAPRGDYELSWRLVTKLYVEWVKDNCGCRVGPACYTSTDLLCTHPHIFHYYFFTIFHMALGLENTTRWRHSLAKNTQWMCAIRVGF